MNSMEIPIIIHILFPILVSLIIGFIKHEKILDFVSIAVLVIQFIFVIFTKISFDTYEIWKLVDGLTISYRVDELGKFFAVAITFVWLFVGIYATSYMKHEERPQKFMMMYIMSLGSLISLCYSANLMTLYFSFEMMSFMTFPLVTHSREKDAIRAGMKYIGYSVFGAGLGLLGFFFLNAYGVSTEFVSGGVDFSGITAENRDVLLFMAFFMILGFSCKGGIFPLQGWLPSAHPVAPSPASAVLSGVITKAGVLCVIRVVYYIFGADFLRGTWTQMAYLYLVVSTIFMGSMLAYKEKILKKRLAYSTISQLSYVFLGVMLLNEMAFIGAMLQVIFHILAKNLLFLCAGTMIYKTGYKYVKDYKGIGKKMPKLMLMFSVGTLSLIGIPPMSGFISKWHLAQGALEFGDFGILAVVVLLISAVLTAGYLFSIVYSGFFEDSDDDMEIKEANFTMLFPILIFAILIISFGIYSKDLQEIIKLITSSLFY